MALSLYVNTFHIVLRMDPADENSWAHIYGSLCCLREALMCYACRKLAIKPVHSLSAKCQHNICKRCVGSKIHLKCQCKWCSDFKKYRENIQLRLVLQCYKKMCKFIMASGIFRFWRGDKLTSPMLRFVSMVYEGAGVQDDFHYTSKFSNGPLTMSSLPAVLSRYENGNNLSRNGQRTLYSFKMNDTKSPKVMIEKVSLKDCLLANYTDSDVSSDTSVFDGASIIKECLRSVKNRKTCRCGIATRNPGKMTCCGQKCPCYVEGTACINCRCRGCRNPEKNMITSPPIPNFHPMIDASPPESTDMDLDIESFDETSCSDSDKDPSV